MCECTCIYVYVCVRVCVCSHVNDYLLWPLVPPVILWFGYTTQCSAGSAHSQRRYNKRAPGSAWGGACGYNLSHDQLSSVDQHYTNCDPYKARFG